MTMVTMAAVTRQPGPSESPAVQSANRAKKLARRQADRERSTAQERERKIRIAEAARAGLQARIQVAQAMPVGFSWSPSWVNPTPGLGYLGRGLGDAIQTAQNFRMGLDLKARSLEEGTPRATRRRIETLNTYRKWEVLKAFDLDGPMREALFEHVRDIY